MIDPVDENRSVDRRTRFSIPHRGTFDQAAAFGAWAHN